MLCFLKCLLRLYLQSITGVEVAFSINDFRLVELVFGHVSFFC